MERCKSDRWDRRGWVITVHAEKEKKRKTGNPTLSGLVLIQCMNLRHGKVCVFENWVLIWEFEFPNSIIIKKKDKALKYVMLEICSITAAATFGFHMSIFSDFCLLLLLVKRRVLEPPTGNGSLSLLSFSAFFFF